MYIACLERVPFSMQMSIFKDKDQVLACEVLNVAPHSAKKLIEDDNLPPPVANALNSLHVNAFDNIAEFDLNNITHSHTQNQGYKVK